MDSESNQAEKEKELDEKDDDEEDVAESLFDSTEYINVNFDDWENIDKKQIKKKKNDNLYSANNSNNINLEEKQEDSILKTLNLIGSGKFHFNNFHDSVINDSIPKFVMFFFNIKSIKNVEIIQTNPAQKDQKLTKKEIKNIQYVIDFLSTKEIRFQILKFDFEDPSTEESSAVLFYSNFLNLFYVRNYREKIYERCGNILCTKKLFNNYNSQSELVNPRTFAALLHFYHEKNINFHYKDFPNKVSKIKKFF